MEHKALYRQFRPLVFDDVIGQHSVIDTLTNQIANGNISHAYLFTGSRGTGKTTTSKILSRAVNCENLQGINPCNQCTTCKSILTDANMDVFEMDAASNNGVDDIREIREIIKFAPSHAKYKVMIIDEVHMLSKGAFNALLKTLEEPPDYMLFILATTEPHKVPATIMSRCQRFEFKRISSVFIERDIAEKCKKMGVKAETEALKLIVRLSEGAMRDALSLLEQCLSFSGETLSYVEASRILGKIEDDALSQIATAIIKKNNITLINQLRIHYENGKDVAVLLSELITLFRNGMIYNATNTLDWIDLAQNDVEWLKSMSQQISLKKWIEVLNDLLVADQKVRYAPHPWLALEIAFLQLGDTVDQKSYLDFEKRLVALESKIQANQIQVSPLLSKGERKDIDQIKSTEVVKKTLQNKSISSDDVDLEKIKNNWNDYLKCIKSNLVSTYALMKNVDPVLYENKKLVLQIKDEFRILKSAFENIDNMSNIKESFEKVYGIDVNINIIDYPLKDDRLEQIESFFEGTITEGQLIVK